MAEKKQSGGRFAQLRTLREQRAENDFLEETGEEQEAARVEEALVEAEVREDGVPEMPLPMPEKQKRTAVPKRAPDLQSEQKRGPGRPPGRRSDPDYTQISAYVPLDLLLEIQDALAEERREQRQRTARPVSDLIEELLQSWLKKQNIKKSK
jgi:hypothetical protein